MTGILVIVISLPGGWSFYTLVSSVAGHQRVKPHPREGYNSIWLGHFLSLVCSPDHSVFFNYMYAVPNAHKVKQ